MAGLLGRFASRICKNFQNLPTSAIKLPVEGSLLKSFNFCQNQTAFRLGHAFPQFANLPPKNKVSGRGNTFQTKIVRKRQIQDINTPKFDRLEALDYTTWGMLRDYRRRFIFRDYYFERLALRNLGRSKLLPSYVRSAAFEKRSTLPRDSMFLHLRNRCAATGRSRGVFKRYRLSRLFWRNLADYNKLSGVIKASWG